jgi:hypothetical protein
LELQIWEKISNGEDTAEKMASHEGWDPLGTRVLLDMICTLKLLSREGERYSLVPESSYYLLPGKPTYKDGLTQNEFNWEGNGKLAESIRSGERPIHYDATKSDIISLWIADYSRRWVYPENYFESDEKVWESLNIQARDGLRVLDVACGPAPISSARRRILVYSRRCIESWPLEGRSSSILSPGMRRKKYPQVHCGSTRRLSPEGHMISLNINLCSKAPAL